MAANRSVFYERLDRVVAGIFRRLMGFFGTTLMSRMRHRRIRRNAATGSRRTGDPKPSPVAPTSAIPIRKNEVATHATDVICCVIARGTRRAPYVSVNKVDGTISICTICSLLRASFSARRQADALSVANPAPRRLGLAGESGLDEKGTRTRRGGNLAGEHGEATRIGVDISLAWQTEKGPGKRLILLDFSPFVVTELASAFNPQSRSFESEVGVFWNSP
jgi:hypothetical protein